MKSMWPAIGSVLLCVTLVLAGWQDDIRPKLVLDKGSYMSYIFTFPTYILLIAMYHRHCY